MYEFKCMCIFLYSIRKELNENIDLISLEKMDHESPEMWPEKSK